MLAQNFLALMSLDLNLLPILLAIYDTKSVGAAAHLLGMSQPGLSTALKRARLALDDPLFLRTSRGMEPTARARELIDPIRQILHTVDNKVTAPSLFIPAESTTEFRIGMSDIGEAVYLPLFIRWMEQHAPNSTVRSFSLKPKQLEQAMEEGKIDLAVGYFPDFKGGDIFQQVVGTNTFTCLARDRHPVKGKILTMEEFQTVGHVAIEVEGRSQEVFENFLRVNEIRRKVVLRSSHFMSVAAIVEGTDLIATVPHILANFFIRHGKLKVFSPPFAMPDFVTKVHWHRTAHHDSRNQWLRKSMLDLIQEYIRREK